MARRFRVWLDKKVVGRARYYEVVDMPDDASDEECDVECLQTLETMISNELDTGWEEL